MELFSNFFQIAVTLLGFCMSGIRYLKDRKQTCFLLLLFNESGSDRGFRGMEDKGRAGIGRFPGPISGKVL